MSSSTILASHFSQLELERILKIDRNTAEQLLKSKRTLMTVAQLEKLKPAFPGKVPLPDPLLRRTKDHRRRPKSKFRLPKDASSFRVEVIDRINNKVTVFYNRRRQTFHLSLSNPLSSVEGIMEELFVYADLVINPRINRYYDKKDATFLRNDSNKVRKKLQRVLRDEYPEFEQLFTKETRTFKAIYGFDPLSVNAEKEGLVVDPEKKKPKLRVSFFPGYTFTPYNRGDLEFIRIVKSIDSHYFITESPFQISYHSHSGTLIGIKNQESHFLTEYNEVSIIDRPYILGRYHRDLFLFPIFCDAIITMIEDGNSTIVVTKDGSVITEMNKDKVEELLKNPRYHPLSKNYVGDYYIRNGRMTVGERNLPNFSYTPRWEKG